MSAQIRPARDLLAAAHQFHDEGRPMIPEIGFIPRIEGVTVGHRHFDLTSLAGLARLAEGAPRSWAGGARKPPGH
ncbi:hypothetical protein [Mesorhizobium sp. Cs1321R2N1]|uniref:hypothetical protein n=1 Tax=Mesorhizobium sp. Cs1321R2N1 TaxID=3015174 RepID=UPI00301C1BDC